MAPLRSAWSAPVLGPHRSRPRSPRRGYPTAQRAGPRHEDIGAFLDAVDGVAFAVPPDVQAPIAVAAARAGKHLLLEKPLATSDAGADELAEAVAGSGVASVVFFTLRFRAEVRAWLAEVTARGGWTAAWLLVRVLAAGIQSVQHAVAARQGRAVGRRPRDHRGPAPDRRQEITSSAPVASLVLRWHDE